MSNSALIALIAGLMIAFDAKSLMNMNYFALRKIVILLVVSIAALLIKPNSRDFIRDCLILLSVSIFWGVTIDCGYQRGMSYLGEYYTKNFYGQLASVGISSIFVAMYYLHYVFTDMGIFYSPIRNPLADFVIYACLIALSCNIIVGAISEPSKYQSNLKSAMICTVIGMVVIVAGISFFVYIAENVSEIIATKSGDPFSYPNGSDPRPSRQAVSLAITCFCIPVILVGLLSIQFKLMGRAMVLWGRDTNQA